MDAEEYELDEPRPKKPKFKKDPYADLERRVREAVLLTGEDWLTLKFLSQDLRAGSRHVNDVLKVLVAEGVLSPPAPVPYDEEVKVGVRPIPDGFFHVVAFRHSNQWVIGYFSKSATDARKTVLIHGRPTFDRYLGFSRTRRRMGAKRRVPTVKMKEDFANSFRYKLADWDGLAYKVLRDSRGFADACKALNLHQGPWTCPKCKRRNRSDQAYCDNWTTGSECKTPRPKYVTPEAQVKVCEKCGEPDVDGHSRRHRSKKTAKSRQRCLEKLVDAVHEM